MPISISLLITAWKTTSVGLQRDHVELHAEPLLGISHGDQLRQVLTRQGVGLADPDDALGGGWVGPGDERQCRQSGGATGQTTKGEHSESPSKGSAPAVHEAGPDPGEFRRLFIKKANQKY